MKQTGSILIGTIMVYILLCIGSYYIFPEVNSFAVSRAASGVMGVVSWAIAMFAVKKIIKIPA
ncbi:hypothetical protein CYL18_01460 [Pradoshia eiseniae]|uniref:Uncharacterized protein n=1 Tax=Pradoshia eiseniae TaxID=2064768 RepID=A0A2S7N3D2_9BACI|nr:hypothetical protein [Pradoshia eiseniae]PQD96591.1 hypothetical protein CYL18_01460 [Pradoshia eiseniae]